MESVTIAIASFNTRVFTELAIRTAVGRAGCPVRVVVGDSGSTDGTLAMAERLRPRLVDVVDVAPGGRVHADWLDHWLATADTEFLVFVDSDVEFRRSGWLEQMLQVRQRDGVAILGSEWVEDVPGYWDAATDRRMHVMRRPAPWVQLVHVPTVRALECSYRLVSEDTDEVPEGVRTYDVGGWLAATAASRGLVVSAMPPEFGAYYRHYGGRSWRASGWRAKRATVIAAVRLARFRLLRR